MQQAVILVVCLGFGIPALGVELAPNPGFESFSACPSGGTEPYDGYVDDWTTPTNATSNYFNACTTGQWSVPGGAFFSPAARNGVAYSGLYAYTDASADYREYIEAPLLAPLAAGVRYVVSFWVYRASGSRYGVERIGAHFSVGSVGPSAVIDVLPLTPQVESPAGTELDGDGDWVEVSGTFVAAGGEDHLVIGSFVDDAGTVLGDHSPCNCVSGAYYYVEDVSVMRAPPAPLPAWLAPLAALALGAAARRRLRGGPPVQAFRSGTRRASGPWR